ncbi:MAG: Imidazole glycerol phosphate synthase subunit HisF [Alphaproteobacteria bacterium MarineAlpha3_Bin5]|nr:imidazole glycerol phosphate synthase subunit HisF [Magnetovibrio sp.]PPR77115.1 MAG: Imidazole glycerol phosphate synthase subunit HisF [Alphaproteobacteria bacterium MarineAlpha3_Bin5]|tara:strand:+ start:86 stop:841 length:756 start_codon:yes stop_codon:yes gene_type:complete
MAFKRLTARLDVKGPNLIKSIHLEGLKILGDPAKFARKYYLDGADELIYMDIVASLYGRNSLIDIVEKTAHDVFVPITVGGGIRSLEDVHNMLHAGADKVAINTAAVKNSQLLTNISRRFGSQCTVLSIEAKKQNDGTWEAYTDNGRERTGLNVIEWAKKGVSLGAGEILLTSVDKEGTAQGMDLNLIKAVSEVVSVPIIASGGVGNCQHIFDAITIGNASAIAMAHVLHYGFETISTVRRSIKNYGIETR